MAQSVCRQFRGSASTSVCRAYFGDSCGIAVQEATAAATAARAAALLSAAAAEAAVCHKMEGTSSPFPGSSAGRGTKASSPIEHDMHGAVRKALNEATRAAARAESAPCSGYILWQPGVKVRRPKTGEEAISFGSAILICARSTGSQRNARRHCVAEEPFTSVPQRALASITGGEPSRSCRFFGW